jgi:hypothetical protein
MRRQSVLLSLLLLPGTGPSPAAAQDATPPADPATFGCEAPPWPADTPGAEHPPATAEPSPTAAPPAGRPVGTPADAATTAAAVAVLRNWINCIRASEALEYLVVATLMTDRYVDD